MLKLTDVYKTFNPGTVNEKKALCGVNLTLNDGDFVTVIGGNGAGKSTVLNAIAGVWGIDAGSIVIDGTDITRLGEHQRAKYIGRVFQDPMTGTAANMEIQENLAIAARRGKPRTLKWGITKAERAEYRKMLTGLGLGLEDRMTAKVGLLSGGQRQALTLLMATIQKPKLLLLDENHLTAMMVTHNRRDAIYYGNLLIMMNNGRVIFDVSGEEKKNLTVEALIAKFSENSGEEFSNDRALLS